MFRTLFLTIGLFILFWGGSLLFVDKVSLNVDESKIKNKHIRQVITLEGPDRRPVINPPEWFAFAMLSAGAVVVLYTVALPGRKKVVSKKAA